MINHPAKHTPALRFPEFTDSWKQGQVSDYLTRVAKPVQVQSHAKYREIGVRSHGKGIFHKEEVLGKSLGEKRVFWVIPETFVLNIVFAWEQAIALTSDKEKGFIASHRFPMFKPFEGKADLKFIQTFFMRKRGKHLLELASPGGAGRNKTLGQKGFEKLKIIVPTLPEQKKIASFLSAIDKRLEQLRKKRDLLKTYKRGVMQKIFSQEIRFKSDSNLRLVEWENKKLSDLISESKTRNIEKKFDATNVLSVSGEHGIVNQIEHLGRSYAGEDLSNYKVVRKYDIVYTKSPLKKSPFGIIKSNEYENGIVSTLYAVYKPKNKKHHRYINTYFSYDQNLNRYLRPLVNKGAKNDMKINNNRVLAGKIPFPTETERDKISDFLEGIDNKILNINLKIDEFENFKKGLLQKMFV